MIIPNFAKTGIYYSLIKSLEEGENYILFLSSLIVPIGTISLYDASSHNDSSVIVPALWNFILFKIRLLPLCWSLGRPLRPGCSPWHCNWELRWVCETKWLLMVILSCYFFLTFLLHIIILVFLTMFAVQSRLCKMSIHIHWNKYISQQPSGHHLM